MFNNNFKINKKYKSIKLKKNPHMNIISIFIVKNVSVNKISTRKLHIFHTRSKDL